MKIISFGEFVSSNNFSELFHRSLNLVNQNINLGNYIQGIPIPNTVDFVWGTNSGIRTVPILLVLSSLQLIFPSSWEYIYLIISLIMPFFTFLLALSFIKRVDIYVLYGAIFYTLNLWIINRFFTGFWQLNIVYAFLPFLITIYIKIQHPINEKKKLFFYIILYSLITSLILVSQPHFIIIIGMYIFIDLIRLFIKKDLKTLVKLIYFFSLSFIFFLFLNAYFFIPSIIYPEKNFTAQNQYFSLSSLSFNGQHSQIQNVIRFNTDAFSNIFGKWTIIDYLQLVPICLIFLSFIRNKKRNWTYLIGIFVFLFLSKGLNSPFYNLSKWFYLNIPIMHFFRDPSRFLAGVILLGAISISLYETSIKISQRLKILSVFLLITIMVSTNINILLNDFSFINQVKIPNTYINLQTYIKKLSIDNINIRILSIPNNMGMQSYTWYKEKSPISSPTIFNMLTPLVIPLADSSNYPDNYSSQFSSYVYSQFTKNYNNYDLSPLSIKYILVDNNIKNFQNTQNVSKITIKNLLNLGYPQLFNKQSLTLFKNDNYLPEVTTDKPIFAIGNFNTILKLYNTGNRRPVILLNQSVNNTKNLKNLKNQDLFIDIKNPIIALTAERIPKKFELNILSAIWNKSNVFSNYEPYKMTYARGSGQLFTSGTSVASQYTTGKINIKYSTKNSKYHILIKALSISPSQISLSTGKFKKDIVINTNKRLLWTDIGSYNLPKSTSLTLEKQDRNLLIIDKFMVIPENLYIKDYNYVKKALSAMNYINLKKVNNNSVLNKEAKVQILNDKIEINKPSKYITYRFSYGQQWQSNFPATEFISDGYGMTFIAKQKPLTEITYFPNTIYHVSLFISLFTFILDTFFLFYIKIDSIKKQFKKLDLGHIF